MKKIFVFFLLSVSGILSVCAQEKNTINLSGEARVDYHNNLGTAPASENGFGVCLFNLKINGSFGEGFSYAYRQRLNKANTESSFFNSIDYVYLNYAINKNWSLSAGKQIVGIGGYEYDLAPIDIYTLSEFCNNISCYQFGASASYALDNNKDLFTLQLCQSPFQIEGNRDIYALNFVWYGNRDCWNTIYSANLVEYLPHKFIGYLALGNQFKSGKTTFNIDLMGRTTGAQVKDGDLFKDFSIIGSITREIGEHVILRVNASHDVNKNKSAGDLCVLPGTEITNVGGGIEVFPARTRDVRLHAYYSYYAGRNASGTLQPDDMQLSVGLTWRINFIKK